MEQFFPEFFAVQGLPAEQRIVAANDGVLELGQHSLHFVYAPMVHWPEVMMTYETTEKYCLLQMVSVNSVLWT